jgi:hypothetical protein
MIKRPVFHYSGGEPLRRMINEHARSTVNFRPRTKNRKVSSGGGHRRSSIAASGQHFRRLITRGNDDKRSLIMLDVAGAATFHGSDEPKLVPFIWIEEF